MTMMLTRLEMEQKLAPAFPPPQLTSLLEVLDILREVEIERAADTRELKQGLAALAQEVKNLAVAQRQTDQRLAEATRRTDKRFAAMAEVQQRLTEDMAELRATVNDLAISQRQGMDELRAAINDLAISQRQLVESQAELRAAVGGLARDFGFSLEEFVAALLPPYLAQREGITGLMLKRRYFDLGDGRYEEVDLVGEGQRDGQTVTVLVECRATVGGGEARRLADKLAAVVQTLGDRETMRAIVAMNIHPTAEPVAEASNVRLIPYSRIYRGHG